MKNGYLKKYKKIKYLKLIASIIIDTVGLVSYVIPVVGDSVDLAWAPLSGLFIFMLFRNRPGMAILGTVEELIPFTDFIPTAFITWSLNYVIGNKKTLSEFFKKEVEEEQVVAEWTGK